MNGLYTALILLLILFLIGQIRIGALVEYCEHGLFVRVRLGCVYITVFPGKKKEKKDGSKERKTKQKTTGDTKKKGGLLKLALDLIPPVLDTVKRFCRKLRMDKLEMDLVICAPDPADAAIRYGQANALLGGIWQPFTQVFHVKDGCAHVAVDFESQTSTIYILASLSLKLAQAVWLALVFGVKALVILIQNKRGRDNRTKQGEAV